MARALRLAERGLNTTQPNPRVGCVIAHGDEIVGEGWHQRAGEPHAEVFALRAAGERARGASAYVTLEPCSHHGRTPPCADALIEAGIARVVFASEDPNPKVAGAGIQRLREAGISVAAGLMRAAARELNRGFFSRFERARPWVRAKLAMSLDGRTALANGESKWITGEAARADVQRWRARSSAILTGAGTARADDPRLTVRLPALEALTGGEGTGFTPLRAVLDARLDALQPGAHLLDGSAPTLVLHARGAKPHDDRYAHVELAEVPTGANGRIELAAVLRWLAERQVNELQVEAGPTLCGALFERDLLDELLLYVAPIVLGDTARPLLTLPPLANMVARHHLRVIKQRRVGNDLRLLLRPA
ncbi:MAG TPA: bifunctional diaminohydroxyphosphoribosylaminopyrimidine deaminase/5-amino-6-(5-phosphoribosylamino)uracil reductase RibD [Rhodanobacteraceae bacterium]|nr:bifunctional diaminohydroxyphosphoribosylaminopyrimidine deaminase/5-amino-6-(5-phosphoribosylamino)uracil reductase RibD [Rhodanobacteraceae bacterium]